MPREDESLIREGSVSKIREFLFLGDKSTARNLDRLKELGVTHIVNATAESRNYFEREDGFFYKRIEIMDTDAANLMPHLESTVDFMHEALVKGNGVLVHCMQGVSRSPSFVIAYLMKAEKKKLLEAYKSVKAIRPQAKPKPHFLKQLLAWEKILSGTGGAGESWPGGLGGGLASKDGAKVLSLPRGPQLPPSTPGVEGVGSAHGSPDSGERAAVKGPMMPPRLAGPSTGCSPDQGALSGERKQAALVKGLGKGPGRGPLKGPVKGPAMPPHLMHRSSSRDFEDPPEPAAPAAKKRKT